MTKIAEDIASIKTDVSWIKGTMKEHLSQHFKIRVAVGIAVLGAALSLGFAFFSG